MREPIKYRRFVRAVALGTLVAAAACGDDSDDVNDADVGASDADADTVRLDTFDTGPEVQFVDGPLAPPDLPSLA